jgi:hypothetical protein
VLDLVEPPRLEQVDDQVRAGEGPAIAFDDVVPPLEASAGVGTKRAFLLGGA